MKGKDCRLTKREADFLGKDDWYKNGHGNKQYRVDAEDMVKLLEYRGKVSGEKNYVKRLFFDIETSYHICRLWRLGKQSWVNPDQLINHKEIICVSWKWEHEEEIHNLDWRIGEKEMLIKVVDVMKQADEIVAQNGDNFDIKEIRTRCIFHGILMPYRFKTLDTLKKSRSFFNFASNKLDYISQYLNVGEKIKTDFQLWIDVVEFRCEKALDKMIKYCNHDVFILEHCYNLLNPYVDHNSNFAVMKGSDKWNCPTCVSHDVKMTKPIYTPMGTIQILMECNECKKQYKVSNKTYMDMLQNAMISGE